MPEKKSAKKRSSLTLLEVGVILVIAVALGTFVMHRATEARRRAVAGALKAAGAIIKYGDDGSVRAIDMTAMPEDQIQAADIALLTALTAINLDHSETLDEHLLELSGLEQLTKLHLVGTAITDEGCRHLASHPAMRFLDVRADFVSDTGLAHLGKLTELVELRLAQTWITDDGLKSLAGLQKLESLDLRHTDITDAGLKHLHPLKNLTMVRLIHSRVTEEGVEDLRKAMPGLAVEFTPDPGDPDWLRVRLWPPHYTTERDEISRVHVSERAIVQELLALLARPIDDTGSPGSFFYFPPSRGFIRYDQGFVTRVGMIVDDSPPPDLLARLPVCRNLEALEIWKFPLEDDTFKVIHRLRFLRRFWITGKVTDRHLRDIARLPHLANLTLHGTAESPMKITDGGLKSIFGMSSLTDLYIKHSTITDEGLRQLTGEKLPKLSFISLQKMPNVTREGVFHLLRSFPEARNHTVLIIGDEQIKGIYGDEQIEKWESEFHREERKRLSPCDDVDPSS